MQPRQKAMLIGVMTFCSGFFLALTVERFHVLPVETYNPVIFSEMMICLSVGLLLSALTAVEIYKFLKK